MSVKSEEVHGRDLHLGDVVDAAFGTWSTSTVKNLSETEVTLFRPYVHTADFSNTGGVICYLGFEEWKVSRNGMFKLLEYGKPLK